MISLRRFSGFASIALLTSWAVASGVQAADVTQYECQVIVIAKDLENGSFDQTFKAEVDSGSHGGAQRSFRSGKHEVVTLADGRWMGVSWFRGGKKIAEGVFVYRGSDAEARVLMLFNPQDSEEQVSLNCSPVSTLSE